MFKSRKFRRQLRLKRSSKTWKRKSCDFHNVIKPEVAKRLCVRVASQDMISRLKILAFSRCTHAMITELILFADPSFLLVRPVTRSRITDYLHPCDRHWLITELTIRPFYFIRPLYPHEYPHTENSPRSPTLDTNDETTCLWRAFPSKQIQVAVQSGVRSRTRL